MRTNVAFRHPAVFVPVSDNDSILAVGGVQWFVALLRRVPDLQITDELCQEDWGVVLFVRREQKEFWIGLSMWSEEHEWLGHFYQGLFAWWQRVPSSGQSEVPRLPSRGPGVPAG